MRKILMLLVTAMLLFSTCGQAIAYFEDGHLVRVVYSDNGTFESATDLGDITARTSNGPKVVFNTNNFTISQLGGTASFADSHAAYFSVVNNQTAKQAWLSGPSAGQVGSGANWSKYVNNAHNTLQIGYQVTGGGGQMLTLLTSDPDSYWKQLDAAGSSVGQFASFIPAGNGEASLATLETAGYVDQYLYYYNSPINSRNTYPGLNVATLRTFADGHTELNPTVNMIPAITTGSVSSITANGATAGGNIVSNGGVAISASGVCWSTSANPTVGGTCTTDGTASGVFYSSIIGLTPNTLYHVRAYATNSVGTSYGTDLQFTTSQATQYTVTITSAGTGSGTVQDDKGTSFAWINNSTTGSYASGSTITFTATATTGSTAAWSGDCDVTGGDPAVGATCTINSISSVKNITATFTPVQYTLTITVTGSGSVSANSVPVTGPTQYDSGTQVNLSATAGAGSTFSGWSGDAGGSNVTPWQITMNSNMSITATFDDYTDPGTCTAYPFMIGVTPLNYPTLQGALDGLQSGETLKMRAVSFNDNPYPVFRQNIPVLLVGGYSCDFSSNSGGYTTIHGSLTIGDGTVTAENIAIQ